MSPTLTLTLEIEGDQQPLRGRLQAEPNTERSFTGWIGLLSALQEAIIPVETAQARTPEELPD
jgi:hypothetical protein